MDRSELLKKPVRDLRLREIESVTELVRRFGSMGGFMSTYLYRAAELFLEMVKRRDCHVFMSFPANIVATGLRGVIADLIGARLVDSVITTGGTFDHDIARGFGGVYYQGFFEADDQLLRELEIHRLGNVFIPLENYGPLIEKVTIPVLQELVKVKFRWSPSELAYEFGKRIKDDDSILRQAYLRSVPVYSPGIVDSSFGTQLFFFAQTNRFELDLFSDMKRILETVFESKCLGGLVIGGGISKHHLIWWSQFKEGLDYSIYLTTASEWDGSLSGARPREAISWGKIKPRAKHVTVYGDVTVLLPIIAKYVYEEMNFDA